MRSIRLGSGAGYSGDRIEPAVELAEHGDIDYLVFECLAERTIALAQQAKQKDPGSGFDPLLESRMRAVLMAQLVHEFGWALNDWTRLGQGTVVGHLLECAGQITGGYFADPGFKDVADLARLGFPIGEVTDSGDVVVTKVASAGGRVTPATCKEQLLYEIHDPSRYFQPDVVADFSNVSVEEIGTDRVRVTGGRGSAPTGLLKVSV